MTCNWYYVGSEGAINEMEYLFVNVVSVYIRTKNNWIVLRIKSNQILRLVFPSHQVLLKPVSKAFQDHDNRFFFPLVIFQVKIYYW